MDSIGLGDLGGFYLEEPGIAPPAPPNQALESSSDRVRRACSVPMSVPGSGLMLQYTETHGPLAPQPSGNTKGATELQRERRAGLRHSQTDQLPLASWRHLRGADFRAGIYRHLNVGVHSQGADRAFSQEARSQQGSQRVPAQEPEERAPSVGCPRVARRPGWPGSLACATPPLPLPWAARVGEGVPGS